MMIRQLLISAFIATSLMLSPAIAQDKAAEAKKPENEAVTLIELLERVKEGRVTDNADNKRRENAFLKNKNKQQSLLDRTNAAIKREEGSFRAS